MTDRPLLLPAFCVLSAASLSYAIAAKLVFGHDWLWDLQVYQAAVDLHLAGGDPYAQAFEGLRFVYPPLVLEAFAALGAWLTPAALTIYAAILAVFWAYAPGSLRWALLLYFGALPFVTEPLILALRTGNLSVFVTLALLLLWRRQGTIGQAPLLFAIVLAAAIKPQYAAFLALGLLSGRLDLATWLRAGAGLVAVCAVWAGQAIWAPDTFAAFRASLDAQLGLGQGGADMGRGLLAILHDHTGSLGWATAGHFAFLACVTACWGWILMRTRTADLAPETRGTLIRNGAFLICLLASPRLKIYDTAVLGLICVEAGVIWGQARFGATRWVLPLICLSATMAALSLGLHMADTETLYGRIQPLCLLLFFGIAAAATSSLRQP